MKISLRNHVLSTAIIGTLAVGFGAPSFARQNLGAQVQSQHQDEQTDKQKNKADLANKSKKDNKQAVPQAARRNDASSAPHKVNVPQARAAQTAQPRLSKSVTDARNPATLSHSPRQTALPKQAADARQRAQLQQAQELRDRQDRAQPQQAMASKRAAELQNTKLQAKQQAAKQQAKQQQAAEQRQIAQRNQALTNQHNAQKHAEQERAKLARERAHETDKRLAEQRKRISKQEQQLRIEQEHRRLEDYRRYQANRAQIERQQAQILQQQRRTAQYRYQLEYYRRLQAQQAQLASLRYDYNSNPYFYTPAAYRYAYNGTYRTTNRYGATLLRQAINYGYQEGLRAGGADRHDRWRHDYRDSYAYRDASYGYDNYYVDRDDYNYYFRQGFQRGYQDGYYSRSQYGSYDNGNASILQTVLSLILNLQPIS